MSVKYQIVNSKLQTNPNTEIQNPKQADFGHSDIVIWNLFVVYDLKFVIYLPLPVSS